MKKIKRFIVGFLGILLIVSCSDPTVNQDVNSTNRSLGTIKSVCNIASQSIFTGEYEWSGSVLQNSAKTVTTQEVPVKMQNALLCMDSLGKINLIEFMDSNNNKLVLNITELKKLSDETILANYDGVSFLDDQDDDFILSSIVYSSGTCLINFASKVVYDLSGYEINDSFLDGSTLYIRKGSGAIYKIELSNLEQALPLNNSEYTPLRGIYFLLNDWLITADKMLVDVTGVKPPFKMKYGDLPFTEQGEMKDPFSIGGVFIKDGLGQFWIIGEGMYYSFSIDENGAVYMIGEVQKGDRLYFNRVFSGDVNINGGTFTVPISEGTYICWDEASTTRYYVTIKGKKEGGIDISYLPLEFSDSEHTNEVYMDNAMYWIDQRAKKIYKMDFLTGVESVIYENQMIIDRGSQNESLLVSGNHLIFYLYENATTVNTYSLVPGLEPVLLSKSKMEIDNIIELKL